MRSSSRGIHHVLDTLYVFLKRLVEGAIFLSFSITVPDDHHYEEEMIASLYFIYSETEIKM